MRLTTKQFLEDLHWCSLYDEENDYKTNSKLTDYNEKCIDKLSQLEDLEEELGIDLITLFKLIDKGAYIKGYKEPIKHTNNLQLNNYGRAGWCLGNRSHNLWLKQYGEYFALTKEELER